MQFSTLVTAAAMVFAAGAAAQTGTSTVVLPSSTTTMVTNVPITTTTVCPAGTCGAAAATRIVGTAGVNTGRMGTAGINMGTAGIPLPTGSRSNYTYGTSGARGNGTSGNVTGTHSPPVVTGAAAAIVVGQGALVAALLVAGVAVVGM
ncbi:hypothetical protein FN846DRAFT_1023684 [Sphaerosporella brunnea]|uniref:Uncharacterized protein n=1 Tax=Sphaerosporella brunnea TaxID=1250544 RepID=A0A5J5EM89_9PEZI|nr:hypothetical protein FN846DRAFT_1023684 [Sphaerosporella brunnea]